MSGLLRTFDPTTNGYVYVGPSTGTSGNGARYAPLTVLSQGYAAAGDRWQYAGITGGIVDTADVVLTASAGAGLRNYLTSIQYINTAAVASEIVVKDGATVIWRGMAPASMTFPATVDFSAAPLRGTAATALNVAMVTTGTATRVSAQGFKGS